jgi:hypothetical protein
MRIKILFDNKKGSTRPLDQNFELIRDLIQRYPNALWRKIRGKNGQQGYELDI